MKQLKMKTIAVALGTAVLLGTGMTAHAESTTPSGSKEKSGSVGQYVDDATITARVKSKFASDDSVSATRIKVDTVKGIVELSGNVANEAERERAITLARAVPDVRGVRNNLTIQGPTSSKPSRTDSPS